jgi:D-alanine transaminase
MQNKTVYLNGQYLPLSDAKISVLDRGFLFGDGVYEVIPSYLGKLFHFSEHIQRLENSLNGIRISNPYSTKEWLELFTPLLDASQNQYIYLQVTRGVAPKRDHAFPENIAPTIFAMSANIPSLDAFTKGVKAISLDDTRWQFCNIKAITLLANILLRQEAVEQDSAEAILVKNGYVTEGAASNVFAVIDGVLLTPPKDNSILLGITRDVIFQLAKQNNIPYRESAISQETLKTASEIWITSSIREIVPIIELDAQIVAQGMPGPIWQTMNQLFQDHKNSQV